MILLNHVTNLNHKLTQSFRLLLLRDYTVKFSKSNQQEKFGVRANKCGTELSNRRQTKFFFFPIQAYHPELDVSTEAQEQKYHHLFLN